MLAPLIIAHRGASAVAPENTTAAFKAAIAAGADGIEFDVRLSRDGVPVVIHDDTLRRTHGLRRRVGDMTLNELNKVDVPSVEQLIELFASNKLILYLEMKDTQIELAEACCRLVEEYRLKDRVVFECFEHAALEVVRNIDSSLQTAALFQPPSSFILKRAQAVGASELALHHRLTSKHLVKKARLANLKVVTWTVDDPAWVSRARAHGIHALITNNPAALIAARDTV
ncbi:MAG TPA: glycerophosphodiester phosphodiesterase family protein [Pyrinomonadaceae bacterium]|nr:glycerophosphodiester phosphodiesterase family protein [Pyrinomonadaceae bacterium]